MPSAVWQGFFNLLRAPPLPAASRCVNRPLFPGLCRRQDTSLALSKASKTPKMASKTDQGGHRSRQDGPRALQDCLRGPTEAPRPLQEDPQEGPKRQKPLMFIVFFCF